MLYGLGMLQSADDSDIFGRNAILHQAIWMHKNSPNWIFLGHSYEIITKQMNINFRGL